MIVFVNATGLSFQLLNNLVFNKTAFISRSIILSFFILKQCTECTALSRTLDPFEINSLIRP